jgi:hypothetical protein
VVIIAIKGGQIIHTGNGTFLIDRIQTAGPGQLNIPTEKIYELGNYKSVATIRDTPDITFSMESFDVSTEVEDMLTGGDEDFATGVDLAESVPVDIASMFKGGLGVASPYAIISSVALPFLYLESASYRFGVGENSTQTFSLRGDSIFYNPGPTYVQTANASGSAGQTVATTNPAYQVAEGDERRVLSVTVNGTRLAFGADYTESYGAVSGGAATTTVTITDAHTAGTGNIRIMYASPTALSFIQASHPDTTVKPAAVRGKDISVYVGGYDPTDVSGSADNKLVSVQNVTVDWRVTLERDEEMGNPFIVGQDFEVPDVSGNLNIKPRTPQELASLIRKVQGVSDATKVLGAQSAVPLEMDIVIYEPGTTNVVKRLHIPDARFSLPGFSGRVQSKTTWDLVWSSDEGTLLIFDGSVEAGSS